MYLFMPSLPFWTIVWVLEMRLTILHSIQHLSFDSTVTKFLYFCYIWRWLLLWACTCLYQRYICPLCRHLLYSSSENQVPYDHSPWIYGTVHLLWSLTSHRGSSRHRCLNSLHDVTACRSSFSFSIAVGVNCHVGVCSSSFNRREHRRASVHIAQTVIEEPCHLWLSASFKSDPVRVNRVSFSPSPSLSHENQNSTCTYFVG